MHSTGISCSRGIDGRVVDQVRDCVEDWINDSVNNDDVNLNSNGKINNLLSSLELSPSGKDANKSDDSSCTSPPSWHLIKEKVTIRSRIDSTVALIILLLNFVRYELVETPVTIRVE